MQGMFITSNQSFTILTKSAVAKVFAGMLSLEQANFNEADTEFDTAEQPT